MQGEIKQAPSNSMHNIIILSELQQAKGQHKLRKPDNYAQQLNAADLIYHDFDNKSAYFGMKGINRIFANP